MSSSVTIVLRGINPVPWKAPHPGRMGRKTAMFQDEELRGYKQALREIADQHLPSDWRPFNEGPLSARFMFWRQLESWTGGHNQVADATNLMKSTEDALQTYSYKGTKYRGLYTNDRFIQRTTSSIIEQGPDVEPMIAVIVNKLDTSLLDVRASFDLLPGLCAVAVEP